jgi:hypothetical protein
MPQNRVARASLLTRSSKSKLRLRRGDAHRTCKTKRIWRTPQRFERVTFAFGGQRPAPRSRNNAFNQSQEWGVASPRQPRHSVPPKSGLCCFAKQLFGFSDAIDCRRKLKGRPVLRLTVIGFPGAGRRSGRAERQQSPFASRLMALLSMTSHWAERLSSKTKSHFPP